VCTESVSCLVQAKTKVQLISEVLSSGSLPSRVAYEILQICLMRHIVLFESLLKPFVLVHHFLLVSVMLSVVMQFHTFTAEHVCNCPNNSVA